MLAIPDPNPVLALSALAQGALIRDGSLTSVALTEAYLARIARLDGELGAFVHLRAAAALAQAARLDAMRTRGRLLGPFHGVPTAVKDLHFLRGAPVRMGSRAWRWLWSPHSDSLVRRLERAGFVILGKTSTSELALLPIVETDLHPPTRNPWDTTRTAGGSSGGSGAAVAGGLIPIAPGSDGAGSIRIPSSLNGLVGLKPSRGRIPDDTARLDHRAITTLGPMAHTVDDAAALLDVLADADTRFADAARHPPRRLRVGVMLDPPFGETEPGVASAVRGVADRLRALGHHVEDRPPVTGLIDEFLPIYQELFGRIPILAPSRLQPVTRWFREQGLHLPPGRAEAAFHALSRRGHGIMDGLDVLLTPTVPRVAPPVGAFQHPDPPTMFERAAILGAFTAVSNVTGRPAITVPAGMSDGLPVGAQLVGAPAGDGLLLALARTLTG